MMKFKNVYKLKIIFIALSTALLFTDVLYSAPSKKESLRAQVGTKDMYQIMNQVASILSKHNYSNFQHWLKNIPHDKLENTAVFLDVLETVFKGLMDPESYVRGINAEILKAMINKGLVSKEEAIREIKERNILEITLNDLADSDSYVRGLSVGALKALIDAGLVNKKEIIKEIEERGILETTLKGFVDSNDDVRKANAEVLKTLIDSSMISKKEIKERKILEIVLNSLTDSNSYVCGLNFGILKVLIDADMVSEEEIKEKKVLEIIVKGFLDSNSYVRGINAEILKAMINKGLVSEEGATREIKEKNILEITLKNLTNSNSYMRGLSVGALKILIDRGLISKEEAIKEIKEKNILELILKCFLDSNSYNRGLNAETLKILIDASLVSEEEIKEKKVLEIIVKGLLDSNSYVRGINAEILKAMINKGLVSKEETAKEIKEKNILEITLNGLSDSDGRLNAKTLKILIDASLVSEEEIKEKNILETALKGIADLDDYVRGLGFEILRALIDMNMVSEEEIKEKNILEIALKGIADLDNYVRGLSTKVLRTLINKDLLNKEEKFTKEEIKIMFEKIYGKGIINPGHVYYYLKFLNMLKDNPPAAYQIFNWNAEELSELFKIFDYFHKSTVLDLDYNERTRNGYFSEKELIKLSLNFFKNPKIFIKHLKESVKTTIKDNSVKLAIKVDEIASINAARGLIKALDLDKDNVIILYDKEIDFERAEKFFLKYNIRAYSGFYDKGVIKIEFHDYGNAKIKYSDDSLSTSLCCMPFKFSFPERASEEELNKTRESLGAGSRKVIVVGSPSEAEFSEFMQSYNALYGKLAYTERPLLIVGFRQRINKNELKLLGSLSGQSIAVRSDDKASLPDIKNNNILILNTLGELLGMYALADVAIIGNDRNIFEPASQKTAVLYFPGDWHNNRDAKNALVEAEAVQTFSEKNLDELISNPNKAKKLAENGFKTVEKYKKEVLSKAYEFVFRIVAARYELRNKFFASLPIKIEQIVFDLKNGVPLSSTQLADIGFNNNEELFIWLNNRIAKNAQLMSELNSSNYPVFRGSGGQSKLETNPQNPDYALKTVVQNFEDMPIEATLRAFKLSQERLGGRVSAFFLPADFFANHKTLVRLVKLLDDQYILQRGKAFVDEHLELIEDYWRKGVFDHDLLKLDGLGIDKQNKIVVCDFGLSEDTLDEDLFTAPVDEKERFWNTFNIAIDKLHDTRYALNKISPPIAKYFEDQIERRYDIKLLSVWNRSMRGGNSATDLAQKLRIAVKHFRPKFAAQNYVFPFIGGDFDRFIISEIKKRYEQYNSSVIGIGNSINNQQLLMLNI